MPQLNPQQNKLLYCAKQLGYITDTEIENISAEQISLELYLQNKAFNKEQIAQLRWLFIQSMLLQYAQNEKRITEQQCQLLFNNALSFARKNILQYPKALEQFLSQQVVHSILQKLYSEKILKQQDILIIRQLIPDLFTSQQGSIATSQNTSSKPLAKTFAHYTILQELGRGGMGVVYKVQDTKLNRIAALKLILSNQSLSEKNLKRFIQETRAIAQLEHPNIVKLFEVGNTPEHYYTMEYIEGKTLKFDIQSKQLKEQMAAEILYKIADALHSAHSKGIIHRDIKPSNILLTADKEPKIMDFGLVKMDSEEGLSQSGDLLGTPAYMPPEQFSNRRIDKRVDIYSLGATLYEIITGRPPFQGRHFVNIICQINDQDPIAPRILNPDISTELEAICLKCLEKDPNKRYTSAAKLALDLQNFINNQPIEARPPNLLTHINKFITRNAFFVALVTGFSIILFSFAIFYIYNVNRSLTKERDARNQAHKQSQLVAKESEKARLAEQKAKQEAAKARVAEQKAKQEAAKARVAEQKAKQEQKKVKERLFDNLILQNKLYKLTREWQKAKETGIEMLELSKELKVPPFISHLELWKTYRYVPPLLDRFDLLHTIEYALASANGKYILAVIPRFSQCQVLELKTRKIICTIGSKKIPVTYAVFSPDSKYIMTSGSEDNYFRLWDIKTGKQMHSFAIFAKRINPEWFPRMAFSPDGAQLIANNGEYHLALLDPKTGKKLYQFPEQKYHITCVAFAPNNRFIAFGLEKGRVKVWDLKKRREIATLQEHIRQIRAISFSANSKILLTGSLDATMRLWNIGLSRQIHVFQLSGPVTSASFSPDDKWIVSLGNRGTLWETSTRKKYTLLTVKDLLLLVQMVKK